MPPDDPRAAPFPAASGPAILPVGYATASAAAVAALVAERYALPGPPTCRLLARGFNDVYAVNGPGGWRHVLRLSGHRARGPADVAAETAFLAHLDAVGVPVAAAIPARNGALFTHAVLPDGSHAAVLFRHADGRRPDLDDPADARAQAIALARVHDAADGFPGRDAGRQRLDLRHLLHRPLRTVEALGLDAPEARRNLSALADRLAARIRALDPDLSLTRCHGDCHGLNARIATEGAFAGQAVLFDFDDGGPGYLAYDLAVHLWAQVSFGRRRFAMWHAFERGYRSVRTPGPADAEAVPVFVAIRHIWLMGEYAGRTAEWGSEVLSPAWLAREVAFLLAWEAENLSPRLL